MASLTSTIAEIKDLATKAKLSTDQFINAATVLNERQTELDNSRRASPDDKAAIDAYLAQVNGELNSDMPIGDILASAGVSKKQGTSNYARAQVKKLLLTYQPKSKRTS